MGFLYITLFTLILMGGVGMGCYYRIAEFLGGKLEQIANTQMYDKYVFTFKNVRNNM